MLSKETKKKIIFDTILVLALLVISLSALYFVFSNRNIGSTVRVSVDGETVAEYSLYKDGEYSLNGGTNVLKIEDGRAYMIFADCPDKTCVRKGKIYYIGDDITCLPNRVRVEILQ